MFQQEVQLTAFFNVESLDIGGPSVSLKGHLDQERNLNDKYSFYNQCNTDLGEFVYHDEKLDISLDIL